MSRMTSFVAGLGLAAILSTGTALAGDAESCKKVRLSDVGWTDIQATTGVASVLLTALGYEPDVIVLQVPDHNTRNLPILHLLLDQVVQRRRGRYRHPASHRSDRSDYVHCRTGRVIRHALRVSSKR